MALVMPSEVFRKIVEPGLSRALDAKTYMIEQLRKLNDPRCEIIVDAILRGDPFTLTWNNNFIDQKQFESIVKYCRENDFEVELKLTALGY
jgi:hypothetical protein